MAADHGADTGTALASHSIDTMSAAPVEQMANSVANVYQTKSKTLATDSVRYRS